MYDLQKASMWKRASAFLFDVIILVIATVGFGTLISGACGYDQHINTMTTTMQKYETMYNVKFNMTEEETLKLSVIEIERWNKAYEALIADAEYMQAYNLVVNLSFLIITFGVLAGYLLLEFAVPLFLGNGQTLGKKIFSLAVMREDSIKVVGPLMLIRTLLGKFTLETMIPIYLLFLAALGKIGILGPIIIGLILLVQVILMIATHTNSMIHDLLAKTVVVDMSSQMIFENEEELIAYKEKLHAEEAARKTY